jgi:plasminogen activator inhibitor 1 RNA-binding protein
LDEYLAEKANKSLKVALPEARKANDSDDSAFKGAVVVEKAEFEEFFVSKESKAPKKATDKVKKEKVLVDIEQRFAEKPREFRTNNKTNDRRGGRGGNKNARRGGNKSNSAAPAVNLQDASAFPTLGATA